MKFQIIFLQILNILLLISCTTNSNIGIVFVGSKKEKFTMDVPKNYHFIRHQITWEKEDYYIYKDSAYIYISDFDISPNYNNIANLGDSILSYRFQNKELYREVNNLLGEDRFKIVSDTLELYGINVNGLFWKDIKIGNISIGYNNVSEEEKVIYDKAINTFKKK